jgi:hypothetical protein
MHAPETISERLLRMVSKEYADRLIEPHWGVLQGDRR